MRNFRKICLGISGLCLLLLLVGLELGQTILWQPAAVGLSVCLAIGLGAVPALQGFQYTAWIITAVVAGMIYPAAFLKCGDFGLRNKWLILVVIQLVMFGMGLHMGLKDFAGLRKSWRGVLIGLLCHFSI